MLKLKLDLSNQQLKLLCIGAHSDDLEIGCGGTILEWISAYKSVEVTWAVLSAPRRREAEARDSADELLKGAKRVNLLFPDINKLLMSFTTYNKC